LLLVCAGLMAITLAGLLLVGWLPWWRRDPVGLLAASVLIPVFISPLLLPGDTLWRSARALTAPPVRWPAVVLHAVLLWLAAVGILVAGAIQWALYWQ
jgi:hypothetical protein